MTNVEVTTTVTLMIPVQTATMDEPEGSLERDLIVRGGNHEPTGPETTGPANTTAAASAGSTADGSGVGGRTGAFGGGLGYLDPLAKTDDFGQPVPDPSPFVEPTWQQTCAMGFEIPGIGVIGGDVVAGILDRFETRIARVLLDERTGVVIETSINEYLPNRAIRRFIQERDGHCRFPGCARNARRCEPDHVIPYSRGGPTAPWNLASLCQHHHRVKHNAGWRLVMTREGVCTWTDPHGRQYTTTPSTTTNSPPDRQLEGSWWLC